MNQQRYIVLYACQKIDPGEELLYCYGQQKHVYAWRKVSIIIIHCICWLQVQIVLANNQSVAYCIHAANYTEM